MDKFAPFHHHYNPLIHQNGHCPPIQKPKPRAHSSPTSVSLASTATSLAASTLSSPVMYPSPGILSGFGSLDGLSDVRTLGSVKAMHSQVIKSSDKRTSEYMAKTLITFYLELGDFRLAAMVFFLGFARNYAMWSNFLLEFKKFGGDPIEILEVFKDLHCLGVNFDGRLITLVLKICASLMDLCLGLEIHASLIKKGLEGDVYVKGALMKYYGRCWGVDTANKVFDEIPYQDNLLNEAIMINLKNKRFVQGVDLFKRMQFSFKRANAATILKMLQACGKEGALNEGQQIHGEAWSLLQEMESSGVTPDLVTWNCLLSGHALHGLYKEVIKILRKMQIAGFRPNSQSIPSILQAVIELGFFTFGKEIHGYVLRNGLDFDVYVGTSLIDMYLKNDRLNSSQLIFDNLKNKNIFSWNSLISGYLFKGLFDDAKRLLTQMKQEGVKPDLVTWNSLVSGYSIWGRNEEALAVIDDIRSSGLTPNVVSWTSLISGCSQRGNYRESLEFFIRMKQEGIEPNSTTVSSLLRTCGGLSLLQKGKEIHCLSIRKCFHEDAYVETALIDMYSKSGDLKSAYGVFRKRENQTLASWNCMIMGFAIYGLGREAISLFQEMQKADILPDAITFTAVLSGCKNSGLIEEGWKYFDSMDKEYGIEPRIEHYSCMVDLLGRAGYLDEAWDFIQAMPITPDASIWSAFLRSCHVQGHMEFAEVAGKELLELEPDNSANYVLMTNLYAMSNRWDDVERIKDLMVEKGVKIRQIWSWIQIDDRVHVFSAGDKPHPDEGQIYFELYQLVSEMKKVGYVPDINCVYQNIDDLEKEKVLLSHSEKLAITYGLLNTRNSAPIRVVKNTRICPDCHTAAKFMSLVRSREIFLRDGVRFHHFKDGSCSCNDHW
ncbi:hypothetical protein K2173_003357 [Erythroxylum novogranatense]|uniref:DYW domain-containing protein n=1 Tax=Erythroxylum novogranatense TaxID=1862640 RepID=A0AAV8S8D9_9ROSI|nr:hypothetical protein K2173_003357 [Erythroxylum novogranatense]